jgi:hypothetical protein
MKGDRARTQQGQALVAGMLLILLGSVAFIVYFGRAQLTIDKQKLNSAADAAAYSSALWRARALNFDAYANRAIIAQEVAVAQAVTLTGWAQYFKNTAHNADRYGRWIPYVNIITGYAKQESDWALNLATYAANVEIPARAAADYGYKSLLEYSQTAMGMSANTFALGAIAREVIQANDARFSGFVMPEPRSWSDARKRYSSLDGKQRLLDLVKRNLDPFTGGSRTASLNPLKCLGSIEKRGGTSLTNDLSRWESVDTLSLHKPKSIFKPCSLSEDAPIGWGTAETSETNNQGRSITDDFAINDNSKGKDLTYYSSTSNDNYGGFSSAMDLDYENLQNRQFPTFDIAVLAYVNGDRLRTPSNLNLAVGRMRNTEQFADLPIRGQSRGMVRLGSAQVYFRKPTAPGQSSNEVGEYASLYSPYWQARITEPDEAQRIAAAAYAQ